MCGFIVTDLTHQHHIRVLPQDRPQGGREREPGLFVHLHLHDATEAVLHRVFDRDDVDPFVLHEANRRIERGGLTRTRWPGHEDDAVAVLQQFFDGRRLFFGEPE